MHWEATLNSVIDAFNLYFEMISADTDVLKQEVYKLRYQVYCLETGFEDPEQYPLGLEFDEYDPYAKHYLIRHRRTGEYAATTRMILANPSRLNAEFPLERYFQIDDYSVLGKLNRSHLGEASRLCVSKTFKQRKSELTLQGIENTSSDYFLPDERRVFPHISFALIACLIKACDENHITHFFGTLEPAWFRFLSAAGIHFTKIGPLIDYHGMRWPGLIKVSDLLEGVADKKPEIWQLLTDKGRYCQATEIVCT